ncbi:MAG TPA: GDP-L-fucose synthase [Kofleriaceae bacterium]|nr:GDP-L-fucose synthase [Kofleriaceae bacterium]
MNRDSRIFVAGHRGLVGAAVMRRLAAAGYGHLVVRDRADLDLRDPVAVRAFFASERPEVVVLAAAKVGGILANSTHPADFIRDNLQIELSVIDAAHQTGCEKLVFLGSSCIYPKLAPQPMTEDALLTGSLEPTNEAYAIAKIAGIKMVQAYRAQYGFPGICLMPTNLYGPGDNFDLQTSHVLPALLRKVHEAKVRGDSEVTIWGTGSPRREFLHTDDLADAVVFLMESYDQDRIVNVGTGKDISIAELAAMICEIVGFTGDLVFDSTKPDGTPRKLLDTSFIESLGWRPRIPLRQGIEQTYRWFSTHLASGSHP